MAEPGGVLGEIVARKRVDVAARLAGGAAGFTQGPRMFMIVLTFSARRTGPACFRPG